MPPSDERARAIRLVRDAGDDGERPSRILGVLEASVLAMRSQTIGDGCEASAPADGELQVFIDVAPLLTVLASDAPLGQAVLWTSHEAARTAAPGMLFDRLLPFLRGPVAVAAASDVDAADWERAIGRRPPVIDLSRLERRLFLGSPPLIERGREPRLLVDLGVEGGDEKLTEALIALEGLPCEVWVVHPQALRPWMRPDMQFRAVAAADVGLVLQSVDAALVDESGPEAADRVATSLSLGVLPIPFQGARLCGPPLEALGLGGAASRGALRDRLESWLAAADGRAALRASAVTFAEAQGWLAAAEAADLGSALAAAGGGAAEAADPADAWREALRRDVLAWRRWDHPSVCAVAAPSRRLRLEVSGWLRGTDGGECDLVLSSDRATAVMAATEDAGRLDSPSGETRVCAIALAPVPAPRGRMGADAPPGKLQLVAIDPATGAAAALPLPLAGGGPERLESLARALERDAARREVQTTALSGRIDEARLAEILVVTTARLRSVPAGLRALDAAGEPVLGALWLEVSDGRHARLRRLAAVGADGLRSVPSGILLAAGEETTLTLWSDEAPVSAALFYDKGPDGR